jgi:hypothetical protein
MHIKNFDPYDFTKKEINGVPVYYKNLPLMLFTVALQSDDLATAIPLTQMNTVQTWPFGQVV